MTAGIHHITAIASDAAKNVNFYTQTLGLRLVKKTVNQDDTQTYHLFFGDTLGHPGMDLTFFVFQPSTQGRQGNGLVTTISFAVPKDSFSFWKERLSLLSLRTQTVELFTTTRLQFVDSDGQQLELVGLAAQDLDPDADVWQTAEISTKQAIRHFYSARLSVVSLSSIEPILTHVLGYHKHETDAHITRFVLQSSKRASVLEIAEHPSEEFGINAAGTVHHIAFRAKDHAHQRRMRDRVLELGLYPTEVIDRFYFQSVYFRTPAGILFEIATDGPGFTADESEDELGKKLALPPFLESQRSQIEADLPSL